MKSIESINKVHFSYTVLISKIPGCNCNRLRIGTNQTQEFKNKDDHWGTSNPSRVVVILLACEALGVFLIPKRGIPKRSHYDEFITTFTVVATQSRTYCYYAARLPDTHRLISEHETLKQRWLWHFIWNIVPCLFLFSLG